MKISELVALLEEVNKFDLGQASTSVSTELEWLVPTVRNYAEVAVDMHGLLQEQYQAVQSAVAQFDKVVESTKQNIIQKIKLREPEYFSESDKLYDEGVRIHEHPETILSRKIELSKETEYILATRIGTRANWQCPGAIIRPGRESWIEHLVALDPLYVVDESKSLISPAVQKFNSQYQSRLRQIVVDTTQTENLLERLPDNQLGFCLAYNFFNFRPLQVVQQYLKELYSKLRPGGVVGFTINDCDRVGGVRLAENHYGCYTPAGMIRTFATELGFREVYAYHINAAVTWIEMAKPGTITSLRGGQTLAKIVARS
jgi:SAM-dependent methyltransferase